MVSGRCGVGKGALAWFVAGSLLLANACSGDGDVSFDPPPDRNDRAGSGGSKPNNTPAAGASTAGESNANSGSTQGGSAHAGNQSSAGNDTGGRGNAGGASAGSGGTAGSATAGSSSGGIGGVAGAAGSTSGAGGTTAGNGGSTAGHGGSTAGNGGSTAGHGGSTAGNGGSTAGNGGSTAGDGGMGGDGGIAGGDGGVGGDGGSGGDVGSGGDSGTGDGDCVAANFGGHGYYFCGVVDSAAAAFAKCQALDMSMLSVESMAENTFALGKQKSNSWLGGTDTLEEGEWRWTSTGAVFWDGGPKGTASEGPIDDVYDDFLVGQPNDKGADGTHENCLAISASGWIDVGCTLSTLRAACESTARVPPTP
jgi:hypothetical protein